MSVVRRSRLLGLQRAFSTAKLSWWNEPMSDAEFNVLANILYSPSPVNKEAAMTNYIQQETEKFSKSNWAYHRFKANAGLVVDTDPTAPEGKVSVMVMGHADKIRLQVKKIASDGKIYIASDSHLPLTLLGNEVSIFTENEDGSFDRIEGGTVEALGAIHFAEASMRSGSAGLKADQMYVELQLHGDKRKEQVTEGLGIKQGDSILMQRRIRRGVGRNSFTGSHLDNGIGCYVAYYLSKLVAMESDILEKVRFLFAYSTHEEIGRFGSRQILNQLNPDILFAVDVTHDYDSAPGVGGRNFPEIAMGKGPMVATGSITSNFMNKIIKEAAKANDIPVQLDQNGTDTGTDAMAGVLSNKDVACVSIGVPVRNMHTISECGVTDDVFAASLLIQKSVEHLSESLKDKGTDTLKENHPDLSHAKVVNSIPKSFFENAHSDEKEESQ